MATDIKLPAYPTSGKGTVLQLEQQRNKYRSAIDSLREEIKRAEDEFAASFQAVDQRTANRDRISATAKINRNLHLS
jgi:uncharacterized membrane protein YkvA (DUF1232 family)